MIARNPLVRRLGMAAVLLGAAILTAACEAPPTEPTSATPDPVVAAQATLSGPAAGHPVVIVRQGPGEDQSTAAGAPVVDNLTDALNRVASGGTIRIQEGTYVVQDVPVNQPVTLEPFGSGTPVLDAQGAFSVFRIEDLPEGQVIIRGLRFQAGWATGILIEGSVEGEVTVQTSDFSIDPSTRFGNGVDIGQPSAATVTLLGNRFQGGSVGVSVITEGSVEIRDNIFTGQAYEAMRVGPHPGGRVEVTSNVMTDCGGQEVGCVFVSGLGGFVEVLDNRLEVVFDRQVARFGQTFDLGFFVSADRLDAVRVTDNEIIGIGGPQDPADRDTWPMREAALNITSVDAVVSRNRLSGAWKGLTVNLIGVQDAEDPTVQGVDNVISSVSVGIASLGPTVRIRSSDITDYAVALDAGDLTPDLRSDFTCNWWGTAAGPQNPHADPSLYTPWATEPVAGTSTTTCSGGL